MSFVIKDTNEQAQLLVPIARSGWYTATVDNWWMEQLETISLFIKLSHGVVVTINLDNKDHIRLLSKLSVSLGFDCDVTQDIIDKFIGKDVNVYYDRNEDGEWVAVDFERAR